VHTKWVFACEILCRFGPKHFKYLEQRDSSDEFDWKSFLSKFEVIIIIADKIAQIRPSEMKKSNAAISMNKNKLLIKILPPLEKLLFFYKPLCDILFYSLGNLFYTLPHLHFFTLKEPDATM
jgi:hypothetical protein